MEPNKYQSNEELYFSWWCDTLKDKGIIKRYLYESNTFKLSEPKSFIYTKKLVTKVKTLKGSLLDAHEYTPDFIIEWNTEYDGIFYRDINKVYSHKPPYFAMQSKKNESVYSLFEIKGSFDRNNMTRLFRLNQKWLYDKYDLYVDLLIIPDLFKRTFIPDRWFYTDSGRQPRKINFGVKRFNEYFMWLNNQQYRRTKE